jgi:hypothetical protein
MIEPGLVKHAALGYRLGFDFSVIPIKPRAKVPMVTWQTYQTELADESQVLEWFTQWPDANVGIVTGKISGITVVDTDTDAGYGAVSKYLPPLFLTPTARTQKGGRHLYFKYVPGLSNKVRVIDGVDVRGDGGFVVAPPSEGELGSYEWIEGSGLGMVDIEEMPPALVAALKGGNGDTAGAPAPKPPVRVLTPEHLKAGSRNDTVYHFAISMVKGGITTKGELMTACVPIGTGCTPPLTEAEIGTICDSALKHVPSRIKTLTDELRDWITQSSGTFVVETIYADLCIRDDKGARDAIRQAIKKMVEGGLLLRVADGRYGGYKKPDTKTEEMDLDATTVGHFDFKLPLGLSNLVKLYPGNVVVIAGEPNVGKTAFMLECVRLNMDKHEIDYYTSEMGPSELRSRRDLVNAEHPGLQWKWHPYERNVNFWEVMDPKRVSVIDYLEVTDSFYLIGQRLSEIHNKLASQGLAIVAIQKGWGKELGRGGDLGMEKPRLYVTLSQNLDVGQKFARITKAKTFADPHRNPNGLVRPFTLHNAYRFESMYDWMSMDQYDSLFGTESGKKKPAAGTTKKLF